MFFHIYTYLHFGSICDMSIYQHFGQALLSLNVLHLSAPVKEENLANIFVQLIVIVSLIVTGCDSSLPHLPSTLPANSLAVRIAAFENHIPVKEWFKWNEKAIVDRMEPAMGKWHNLACFGAGGGLWTTSTDLARFGIEISDK